MTRSSFTPTCVQVRTRRGTGDRTSLAAAFRRLVHRRLFLFGLTYDIALDLEQASLSSDGAAQPPQ